MLVYDIFLKLILAVLKSPGGLMQSNGLEHYILTEHLYVSGKVLKTPKFQ